MKKISILALHLGYGGIEKSIVSLANVLCKRYQVEIATCYRLYPEPVFPLDRRVKVQYLNDQTIIPNHEKLREAIRSKNLLKVIKHSSLYVYYFSLLFVGRHGSFDVNYHHTWHFMQ